MNDGITIFKTVPSAGTNASDYLQDAFGDFTLPATDNTGLTSSAATNPLSYFLGNDETTRFGTKTLYVKSISILKDRGKWIQGLPTYEIEWNESFPGIKGYAFGNIDILYYKTPAGSQRKVTPFLLVKSDGGIGVTGIARRVGFINLGQNASSAADQYQVDGANSIATSYSGVVVSQLGYSQTKYIVNVTNTSDSTRDIHDFRVIPGVNGNNSTIRVFGIIASFGESNIDQSPGTSYVNKTKVAINSGATMAMPSFGSSMGGNVLVYKTSSGYTLTAMNATSIQSIATGNSGTNLLTVTTGQGGSFLAGQQIYTVGSSQYFGIIRSVSTDTLTVFPTLSFGVSSGVYTGAYINATTTINASMYTLYDTIDISKISGFSSPATFLNIFEGTGKWAMWGGTIRNTGMILQADGSAYFDPILFGFITSGSSITPGAYLSEQMQENGLLFYDKSNSKLMIEGRFAACDIEYCHPIAPALGTSVYFSVSLNVNGLPGYNLEGLTAGPLKYTVFKDGSNGWNQVQISAGNSSSNNWFITKINLYERNYDMSVSYGRLANIPVNQALAPRGVNNATMSTPGVFQRIYGGQIKLTGGDWNFGTDSTAPGNIIWTGTTISCLYTQQYYGTGFAIMGQTGLASATLMVDGAQYGATLNVMHSVALGWHTVTYQIGGTTILHSFDFARPNGEITSLQKFGVATPLTSKKIKVPIVTDWKEFVMKVTATTTAPGRSAQVRDEAFWRRVGDTMELFWNYEHSSSASGGTGNYIFNLPQGFTVDTTKLNLANDAEIVVGYGKISDSATGLAAYTCPCVITFTNSLGMQAVISTPSTGNLTSTWELFSSSSEPNFGDTTLVITFNARVPILGWSAYEEVEVLGG